MCHGNDEIAILFGKLLESLEKMGERRTGDTSEAASMTKGFLPSSSRRRESAMGMSTVGMVVILSGTGSRPRNARPDWQ
jgi:hypothetical protein